jgi:phosphatidylcholine synthase
LAENAMTEKQKHFSLGQKISAFSVHFITASTAFIGILTLYMTYKHEYTIALWFMAAAVLIDAVDGTLARLFNVKEVAPNIDGELLDNIVDFLNYVITPCFFLLVRENSLYSQVQWFLIAAICITSAYQFTQKDAKTPDHFFKGFPCYWNIAVFYMYLFNTSVLFNTLTLSILCILVFVPIKYVYPSRLDYLTESWNLKIIMHFCTIAYGISTGILLLNFPEKNTIWVVLSLGYIFLYIALSLYRTAVPLIKAKLSR